MVPPLEDIVDIDRGVANTAVTWTVEFRARARHWYDPADDATPSVKIHNIRSSLPEPEIEMIYTVYKGKRD